MSDYTIHNKAVYLVQYHIIWTPKYRRKLLVNGIKIRLEQIVKEVCLEFGWTIKAFEVMPDHVHIFISASPQHAPYKIIKALKGRSSNLLRKEFPELLKMSTLWTRGYFISTIGHVSENTIKEYINRQWKQ